MATKKNPNKNPAAMALGRLAGCAQSVGGESMAMGKAGELADEELYPSDAQWAGIYDRMTSDTPEKTARRKELAELTC